MIDSSSAKKRNNSRCKKSVTNFIIDQFCDIDMLEFLEDYSVENIFEASDKVLAYVNKERLLRLGNKIIRKGYWDWEIHLNHWDVDHFEIFKYVRNNVYRLSCPHDIYSLLVIHVKILNPFEPSMLNEDEKSQILSFTEALALMHVQNYRRT